MIDQETTIARVRYFGWDLPMEFALCLRMRQNNIKSITTRGKEVQFETFKNSCSTFVYVPALMERKPLWKGPERLNSSLNIHIASRYSLDHETYGKGVDSMDLKDKYAIVGIGYTPQAPLR